MKKRLFVTGLTGFVGQHIQSRLLANTSDWELLSVPCRYDLSEPASLEGLWPQMPDAVIHLAGQTFVPEAFRDPARTLNINLLGTLPFAALGWVTPLWAALGMSASSLLVVLNAAQIERQLPLVLQLKALELPMLVVFTVRRMTPPSS